MKPKTGSFEEIFADTSLPENSKKAPIPVVKAEIGNLIKDDSNRFFDANRKPINFVVSETMEAIEGRNANLLLKQPRAEKYYQEHDAWKKSIRADQGSEATEKGKLEKTLREVVAAFWIKNGKIPNKLELLEAYDNRSVKPEEEEQEVA